MKAHAQAGRLLSPLVLCNRPLPMRPCQRYAAALVGNDDAKKKFLKSTEKIRLRNNPHGMQKRRITNEKTRSISTVLQN